MTEKRTLRRLPQMVLIVCVGACAAILASSLVSSAQAPSVYSNVRRASGQIVAPVYEGWFKSGDEIYALFGYFNPNTQEIVNIPVGPNNKVESGALDHGQPTRFYPGRHYGVVAMAVPDPAAMTELNWVLTVQNETLSIPSNLIQEYVIAPLRRTRRALSWEHAPGVDVRSGGSVGPGAGRLDDHSNDGRVPRTPAGRCG